MKVCRKCLAAIISHGEEFTINAKDIFDDDCTCEWCEEETDDEIYDITFN